MMDLVLSELDFDYEMQALVSSFFPGQKSRIAVRKGNASKAREILRSEERRVGKECRL